MKKTEKGFTLIEVLIAVLVLTTLALMAFPAMRDMQDRNYLKASAETMVAELAEARMRAMASNGPVTISFSDILAEVELENGVTVTDPTFSDLVLEPKLAVLADATSAGYVDFTKGNFSIRFGVTPIGQGFICDPGNGNPVGYPPCE